MTESRALRRTHWCSEASDKADSEREKNTSVLARPKPQRGGGGDFLWTPNVVKMQPKCIGRGQSPRTPNIHTVIFSRSNAYSMYQSSVCSHTLNRVGVGGTANYLNRGLSSVPYLLEVLGTMLVPHQHVKLKRSAQRRTSWFGGAAIVRMSEPHHLHQQLLACSLVHVLVDQNVCMFS